MVIIQTSLARQRAKMVRSMVRPARGYGREATVSRSIVLSTGKSSYINSPSFLGDVEFGARLDFAGVE